MVQRSSNWSATTLDSSTRLARATSTLQFSKVSKLDWISCDSRTGSMVPSGGRGGGASAMSAATGLIDFSLFPAHCSSAGTGAGVGADSGTMPIFPVSYSEGPATRLAGEGGLVTGADTAAGWALTGAMSPSTRTSGAQEFAQTTRPSFMTTFPTELPTTMICPQPVHLRTAEQGIARVNT